MGQSWLNRDPSQNRSLLQMALFEEELVSAGPDDLLNAGDLGDDLGSAIHAGDGKALLRKRTGSSCAPDAAEPEIELNDEHLAFFRHIGKRELLAEMVIQSIRDLVYSRDDKRMQRLLEKNPEDYDEILHSAKWLSTPEGGLAVQILYPDWDHVTILRRIHADPSGILDRMTQAGERRARQSALAENGLETCDYRGPGGYSDPWSTQELAEEAACRPS